jgi:hypothetical protein
MQLLVTTEIPTGETTLNYSFRLGVSYRHREATDRKELAAIRHK